MYGFLLSQKLDLVLVFHVSCCGWLNDLPCKVVPLRKGFAPGSGAVLGVARVTGEGERERERGKEMC